MAKLKKDEVFDYYQEVARSAFADMLHDTERNQKYSRALKEAIRDMKSRGRKANVLDIGTGTGLLSMLAVKAGADSVVTIETFSPVSIIARKIIRENGFENKIKIVNKHSTEVSVGPGKDIEQKANILVTEVFDTELIGEGAVKTYNHAHENLMERDCICVPDSASIYVQIVDCDAAIKWNTFVEPPGQSAITCPDDVALCSGAPAIHDLQLSQLPLDQFKILGGPLKICKFDFSGKSAIPTDEHFVTSFHVAADGRASAAFFWWELNMNPSGTILLSCAPHWSHPDTDALTKAQSEVARRNAIPWRDHWMQGCFFLKSLLLLKKGSEAFISASHDEFSWWFDVSHKSTTIKPARPICSCLFHVVNSRNRIMQINKSNVKAMADPEIKSAVFVGDHSMMALAAAKVLRGSKIYVLQKGSLCDKSFTNFFESNAVVAPIEGVGSMLKLNDFKSSDITHCIGEPHFNESVLPWDNITEFFKQINQLRSCQRAPFKIMPVEASIYAIPVHFLHLHKIRWPLKSCEGFDHTPFDEAVALASSMADDDVETFSLWEYPCVALGPPLNIFDLNFNSKRIEGCKRIIGVESFSKACNGVAMWVEWTIDESGSRSGGPSTTVKTNEFIDWKLEERQGVHLIPCSKIEGRIIDGIEITTRYDVKEEKLAMDFVYRYRNLQP